MTRAFLLAVSCWLLGASGAAAQTPTIGNPIWLEEPDASAFRNNYPDQAAHQAVEGFATIECLVPISGELACTVTAEGPASWGFGDAALAIARTFRVAPATRDGVPIEGGRIRRTLRFVLPEDDWRERVPEEFRAYADQFVPDLPTWSEAPTSSMVNAATPEAMRTAGTQGRGILSCRVTRERRLDCRRVTEMPRGSGFAAAAMRLAPHFRIAESDQDFIEKYREGRFLLPIAFNSPPPITPVNRYYTGGAPLNLPPLQAPSWAVPDNLRAAGVNGTVLLVCTVATDLTVPCEIESETPREMGLGQLVLEAMGEAPPFAADSGFMPGDQIRYTIEFSPEPAE